MPKVNLFGEHSVDVVDDTLDGVVWKADGFRDKNEVMWVYRRIMDREFPVLLDVGAGAGAFTLIATIHPTLQVVAMEPVAETRDILERNVELNGLQDRVTIWSCAAWNEDALGDIRVPIAKEDKTLATLGEPSRFGEFEAQPVTLKTIDSLGLKRVDVMKIDTEGAELFVLEGAVTTIKDQRPFMLIELQEVNTRQHGYKPVAVTKWLERFNVTVKRVGSRDIGVWW